jgi:transcriptional regulator GlxA family with amidase domain
MELNRGFLVFPQFQMLDLSGPRAAFEVAGKLAPGAPYHT